MGYVAIKGGEAAIDNAEILVDYYRLRDALDPVDIEQIRTQFRLLIDKVMGEGSVYSPEHAAIALKQMEGDVFESAFILRAFRATLRRNYYSEVLDTRNMVVERRISSAFREIPGGQVLGATRDYTQRLIEPQIATETFGDIREFVDSFESEATGELSEIKTYSKVIDMLKEEGVLKPVDYESDQRVVDVTREAVKFPAPRSAALQMLARSETGGIMALAYSAQRGFGSAHPTIGELRVGKAKVVVKDAKGRTRTIGRIRVSEAEMVTKIHVANKDSVPYMSLGYGLCFGQNETKAISMGILDRTMRTGGSHPCQSQEFVLYHTEGVESYGFTNHLKLPHYVTFQSGLNNLRQAVQRRNNEREKWMVGNIRAGDRRK
jgi:alpha-D-ribose 1-methylphosphonate 5-triphosphate synthase subunit PhnI